MKRKRKPPLLAISLYVFGVIILILYMLTDQNQAIQLPEWVMTSAVILSMLFIYAGLVIMVLRVRQIRMGKMGRLPTFVGPLFGLMMISGGIPSLLNIVSSSELSNWVKILTVVILAVAVMATLGIFVYSIKKYKNRNGEKDAKTPQD